uniref:U4 protein n=1 Tax=Subterranean clover stunt virus TaxID=36772 RepID=A0A411K8D2_SCSV|nr:U4 protein [Subterranean clover stunt virus]
MNFLVYSLAGLLIIFITNPGIVISMILGGIIGWLSGRKSLRKVKNEDEGVAERIEEEDQVSCKPLDVLRYLEIIGLCDLQLSGEDHEYVQNLWNKLRRE